MKYSRYFFSVILMFFFVVPIMNKKVVDPYLIDVNIISTTNNKQPMYSVFWKDRFDRYLRAMFPVSGKFFLLLIDTPISLSTGNKKKHQKKYFLYKKHPNEKIRPTKNIILPKRKKSSSSSDRAKKTKIQCVTIF